MLDPSQKEESDKKKHDLKPFLKIKGEKWPRIFFMGPRTDPGRDARRNIGSAL